MYKRQVLHKYEKGRQGFVNAWGQILEVKMPETDEVEEVEVSEKKPRRGKQYVANPFAALAALAQLGEQSEQLEKAYELLGRLLGRQSTLEDALKTVSKFKKQFEEAAKIFGWTQGGSIKETEPIEYEGKVPIWLHPKVGPRLIREIRQELKEMFKELGLIPGGETEKVSLEGLPTIPEEEEVEEVKPKARVKVEEVKEEVEGSGEQEGEVGETSVQQS